MTESATEIINERTKKRKPKNALRKKKRAWLNADKGLSGSVSYRITARVIEGRNGKEYLDYWGGFELRDCSNLVSLDISLDKNTVKKLELLAEYAYELSELVEEGIFIEAELEKKNKQKNKNKKNT